MENSKINSNVKNDDCGLDELKNATQCFLDKIFLFMNQQFILQNKKILALENKFTLIEDNVIKNEEQVNCESDQECMVPFEEKKQQDNLESFNLRNFTS